MTKPIQVIGRAFDILEHLGPDREVSLDALTIATRLNKGTLCNILKTLAALGYVEKSGPGSYRLSGKFMRFGEASSYEKRMTGIAEIHAKILADETQESGVVCTLREGRVHIIAQAQFQRSLMISPFSVYRELSLYRSVSGRILIAFLSEMQLEKVVGISGFPGAEWDRVNNMKSFEKSCAVLRREGICIMSNAEKEIKAFSVPVFDDGGHLCASLGLTIPISRSNAGTDRKIIKSLKENSAKMEKAFSKGKLSQENFIKL